MDWDGARRGSEGHEGYFGGFCETEGLALDMLMR